MATDISPSALLDFAKAIASGGQSKSGSRLATITRIDESGTAYVQLPGGEETPIATTGAAYSIGDVVSVSMYGGKLRTVDNISAPSVSERVVRAAIRPVSKAAELAKAAANEADRVATAINQHFWADDNGIHVTEADHDATTEHNILINSVGILLRKATNYLVSITQSAIAFYDGLGNSSSNVVAQFGSGGAQIGKSGEMHIEIRPTRAIMFAEDGSAVLRAQFDRVDAQGQYKYGTRITNSANTTFMTISPTIDYSGFTDRLRLSAYFDGIELYDISGTGIGINYRYVETKYDSTKYTLLSSTGFSVVDGSSIKLNVNWDGDINNLGGRTSTNALIVFGYVTGSGKTVQLYAPLPGFAETVTVTGTGSFTLRGGTGATLSTSVAASSITTKLTTGFRNLFEMRFTLSTAFAGGNDVSVSGFVSGLTLTFS